MLNKFIFVITISMLSGAGICGECNDAKGMKALNKACDGGNAESCLELGFEYQRHGHAEDRVPQANYNLSKSRKAYDKACNLGNSEGCNSAGRSYDVKACGFGCFETCVKVRWSHEDLNNYARVIAYYSKACDLGHKEGCTNLSGIYADGKGVVRNNDKAAEYLSKACENGDRTVCTFLGESYVGKRKELYMGVQVSVNYSKGAELFSKACALGGVSSCENLGIMYQKGIGVPQDTTRSRKYYSKACGLGSKEACTVVNKR